MGWGGGFLERGLTLYIKGVNWQAEQFRAILLNGVKKTDWPISCEVLIYSIL